MSDVSSTVDRTISLLRRIGLTPPAKVEPLRRPTAAESTYSLPGDLDEARALLVQQRIQTPGYKPPERHLRNKFSSRRRERQADQHSWTFSVHEVACLLEKLLSESSLRSAGIIEEVLRHASGLSLESVWLHLQRPTATRKITRLIRPNNVKKASGAAALRLTWIDRATQLHLPQLIRIMCQFVETREILHRALHVALSQRMLDIVEVLLSYGADATGDVLIIRDYLRKDDSELVKLLLAAPTAISTEAWRVCLEPHSNVSGSILSLCLGSRPDIPCERMLIQALEIGHLDYTATLLAYISLPELSLRSRELACKTVCQIDDFDLRYQYLELLGHVGCLVDCTSLQEELYKAAKMHHKALVDLLVKSDVLLDCAPNNILLLALQTGDFELLVSLKCGLLGSAQSVDKVLRLLPMSLPEVTFLHVLDALSHLSKRISRRSLPTELLNPRLLNSVKNAHVAAVCQLLALGAQAQFEDNLAVKTAIQMANFQILDALLPDCHSLDLLSNVLPTAIALTSRADRLRAFRAILSKGVLAEALFDALGCVVSEDDGDPDLELIELLLRHNAYSDPPNGSGSGPVIIAASRGEMRVLEMLCDVGPRTETLSMAVLAAFDNLASTGRDRTWFVIHLLLSKGALGPSVDRTLWCAAHDLDRLEIARLLIEFKADVNQRDGALFALALKSQSNELLQALCNGNGPSEATLGRAINAAVELRLLSIAAFEILVKSVRNRDLSELFNSVWRSGLSRKLKDHPCASAIVLCLLQNGLNVDMDNESPLCFAVESRDPLLFENMLRRNPGLASLKRAFSSIISMQDHAVRVSFMRLLLTKTCPAEIGQSQALLEHTKLAIAGKANLMSVFLAFGASVNGHRGAPVKAAAQSGDPLVLAMLLEHNPSVECLKGACLATAADSKISRLLKRQIFQALLAARDGLLQPHKQQLLWDCILQMPSSMPLPTLLLEDEELQVPPTLLEASIPVASREVLTLLFEHSEAPEVAFKAARRLVASHPNRGWIYGCVLRESDCRISSQELSDALIDVLSLPTEHDIGVIKLLLKYGAEPGWKGARAFSSAIKFKALEAFRLLCQYTRTVQVGDAVLKLLAVAEIDHAATRVQMFRYLLEKRVSRTACSSALQIMFLQRTSDPVVLRLLVQKGVEANATAFRLVLRADGVSSFRELCRHSNDGDMIVETILQESEDEAKSVRWLNVYLKGSDSKTRKLEDPQIIPRYLERFPAGQALAVMILLGCPVDALIPFTIFADIGVEDCSMLIWALLVEPKIEGNALMVLANTTLASNRAGYTTPKSGISAVLACLLDASRLPLLEYLIDVNPGLINDYTVSGHTLACFTAYTDEARRDPEDIGPQDPRMASFYLGNFEAFNVLDDGKSYDDEGLLHSAACFALPRFVEMLMSRQDPNEASEAYGNYIPLAVAIAATETPSIGRFANDEADFAARKKKTIELLARKTDLTWRHRGKTVLHFALHQDVETTKILLNALPSRSRDLQFDYTDKEDRVYTPSQYVDQLMDEISDEEKRSLLGCLEKNELGP